MTLPTEEYTPDAPSGELVHWMEPHRTGLGPAGISTGALAAFRYLAPRREGLPPWKWRRGALH